MQTIPEYGRKVSAEEFEEWVDCGAIISDDGTGCWATETEMDPNARVFRGITPTQKPDWATHAVWFNK